MSSPNLLMCDRLLCRIEGGGDKIMLFATDDNLRHLSILDTIYVDGTFLKYILPHLRSCSP